MFDLYAIMSIGLNLMWLECKLYVLIQGLSWLDAGKGLVILHFSCHLWSFMLFGVAELASAFLLFKNVPDC